MNVIHHEYYPSVYFETASTELIDGGFLEVETQLVADHLTAGEDNIVAFV